MSNTSAIDNYTSKENFKVRITDQGHESQHSSENPTGQTEILSKKVANF